jgi:hypothetical protein
MNKYTKEEQVIIDKINSLSREEMCKLRRFSSPGHIYFNSTLPFCEVFNNRFESLGGFSPEISKKIGW